MSLAADPPASPPPPHAHSSCHVPSPPLLSPLCVCVRGFSHYHLLFSRYLTASFPWLSSTDSEFSKTATCFYIRGSFASRSWCGGEPVYVHGGRATDRRLRLSSTSTWRITHRREMFCEQLKNTYSTFHIQRVHRP